MQSLPLAILIITCTKADRVQGIIITHTPSAIRPLSVNGRAINTLTLDKCNQEHTNKHTNQTNKHANSIKTNLKKAITLTLEKCNQEQTNKHTNLTNKQANSIKEQI